MLRPAARWSALTSISIPSPALPSPPCSVNPPDSGLRLIRGTRGAGIVALRLPDLRSVRPALNYSPFLLKLPVLAASTSLRRSRKASPHGCGLRAVFCKDAASARPEACRDKSKAPRSGDVAGRARGYRGRRRLPPPVRSLRHEGHNAEEIWERNVRN
jgi:hypothetical protein